MPSKTYILAEIKRTAEANGGEPLGWRKFETETGIGYHDWHGKHWARWGDATKEAGYAPNDFGGAYDEADLLDTLAAFVKELGHYPVVAELRMKARNAPPFPSDKTLRKLGTKSQVAAKLVERLSCRPGFQDVVAICEPISRSVDAPEGEDIEPATGDAVGFVYLIRWKGYHKIGRTNSLGRRERELEIQLPEKATTVHTIKTDDPVGIERYWHQRFDERRKNGEWFELTRDDVAAFKRRKFM